MVRNKYSRFRQGAFLARRVASADLEPGDGGHESSPRPGQPRPGERREAEKRNAGDRRVIEPLLRRTERATFDQLFADGAAALIDGSHGTQVAPPGDGRRWGVSVVLRPDPEAAASLEALAHEAAAVAGDGHWLTGAAANSHLTCARWSGRVNEIRDDDPCVARYATALRTAVAGVRPLTFAVTGLTLTPLSVMACAVPADRRGRGPAVGGLCRRPRSGRLAREGVPARPLVPQRPALRRAGRRSAGPDRLGRGTSRGRPDPAVRHRGRNRDVALHRERHGAAALSRGGAWVSRACAAAPRRVPSRGVPVR